MKKRFTDVDIWKKPWFRKLTPEEKTLWNYVKDQCDNVGVWDKDEDLAEFHIGCTIDWESFPDKVNGNIMVLPNGKWFLVDFCLFQHPDLKADSDNSKNGNNAVKSYIRDLKLHGLWDYMHDRLTGVGRASEGRIYAPKEKEREKEQDKERERVRAGTENQEPPAFLEPMAAWFKHLSKRTANLVSPNGVQRIKAKEALEALNGDVELFSACVEYYWENFNQLWYYKNNNKHNFSSFCSNIAEIVPAAGEKLREERISEQNRNFLKSDARKVDADSV